MASKGFEITEEQQLKELNERVPPILNVDVVVFRKKIVDSKDVCQFLIGLRNRKYKNYPGCDFEKWLFPGGRMKYFETPQESAERILATEIPGVKAQLKKLGAVISDKGADHRCYGVTLYYLYEYVSGEPMVNDQMMDFLWKSADEMRDFEKVYKNDVSVLDEMETVVRTMNSTQDEMIVEVDKNDKDIGTIVKRIAHSDNSKYHRAAHMMIFNSKGDVVLQQRSLNKSSGAGKWDMHGGHQVAGHTIEQTAYQELSEELGIHTDLTFHRSFLFQDNKQSEFCYVYYGVSDGPYGFDKNEVAQIKTFDCEKLLAGDYDKDYDFIFFVKKYLEELRFFWEKLK